MEFIKRVDCEGHFAKIYLDTSFQEYVVRYYEEGIHKPEADYYTVDLKDANSAAKIYRSIPAASVEEAI